jgi:hypothetical protein
MTESVEPLLINPWLDIVFLIKWVVFGFSERELLTPMRYPIY